MGISDFRIVADSASDVFQLKGIDYASVPLKIITNENEFIDDKALDVEHMIKYLADYKGRSSTACPAPMEWYEAFGDSKYVFCVTLTSKLSGSYNAASLAKVDYEENYPDRKTGYFIGNYRMPLIDFIVDYAMPQDNSNRSDVRWFALSDGSNVLKVTALQEMNFRVWPYSEEDLEAAKHPQDLPERDYVNVNFDYKIHGVGGNDGWGARTMDAYTIDGNQPYAYGFILEW